MRIYIALIVFISSMLLGCKSLMAQSSFYAIDSIREIKLYFEEGNWDAILDDFYIAGNQERLVGNLTIDGVYYPGVGVRYKGFSSYSSSRSKNPFNISLDYSFSELEHQGVNKLKLSNVIQDPSFVRESLSYEIARKYMPSAQANYANVYVNDTLIGLYTNVEAVNKDFLEDHYGTRSNVFFKCNPEHLDLNGENSNLGNTPGADVSNYYPFYKLKSELYSDWNELHALIDTLNDSPGNIESKLNVDRTLWMHALNYVLVNFDSYIGYAQNYYLYQDDAGLFNPILWDLNMSFASYRLTDASNNWDGFTVDEAKSIDPLLHYSSVSVYPRPLLRKLFENDRYRRMYLAHIRTIVEENFLNGDYAQRAAHMQSVINIDVIADTNKFYSTADFTDNLTSTVSDLVDYPGITGLMDARASYLDTFPGIQGSPVISLIESSPLNTVAGDTIFITASVNDLNATVLLGYRFSESEAFTVLNMLDDGTLNDGVSGDGVFGALIPNCSNVTQYYVYAENDSSGRFSPERAAYEYYTIESKIGVRDLAINELMAVNTFSVADNEGEYDDWIEFYNNTGYKISTKDLYLSNDSENKLKWSLPERVVTPGTYFIVWADEDINQSGAHATFKLNKEADSLWLSYSDGSVVDSVVFENQNDAISFGRYPNGTGDFREMLPSYSSYNSLIDGSLLNDVVFIFPNPAVNSFGVKVNVDESAVISIYTIDGRNLIDGLVGERGQVLNIDTSKFTSGIYLVRFTFENSEIVKKIIIKK